MNYDIVIIGGNPAGGTAASSAKMLNKDKSVLVIRKEPESLIPCGIPYTIGMLNRVEDNIKSIEPAKKMDADFLIDEVTKIDSDFSTSLGDISMGASGLTEM